MTEYIDKGAIISACGKYRYRLWREWRGTHDRNNWRWLGGKDGNGEDLGNPKSCVFIMLNPSTADGSEDDPTIRRCVSFAKRHNFERMDVVNLFAYRATKPKVVLKLTHNDDPVGVDNQRHIEHAVSDAGLIICAWGMHGGHLDQDKTMIGWLDESRLHCLGFTNKGKPRHPLMLKGDAPLVSFAVSKGDQS